MFIDDFNVYVKRIILNKTIFKSIKNNKNKNNYWTSSEVKLDSIIFAVMCIIMYKNLILWICLTKDYYNIIHLYKHLAVDWLL